MTVNDKNTTVPIKWLSWLKPEQYILTCDGSYSFSRPLWMVHGSIPFHSPDCQIVPHFPWGTMRKGSPLQMSYCALVIELARMLGNADRVSKFPTWSSVATIYFNWPILYPGNSFSFFIIKQWRSPWQSLLHNLIFSFSFFLSRSPSFPSQIPKEERAFRSGNISKIPKSLRSFIVPCTYSLLLYSTSWRSHAFLFYFFL